MTHYVVYGAGGIGCVIGGRLYAVGHAVDLVARGAHLEVLQARGLTLSGLSTGHYDIPAHASPAGVAMSADTVVILSMKTGDTAQALDTHASAFRGLPVFCFQNGVTNEQLLDERGLRTYGCSVMLGGRILEPGLVAHTGSSALTLGRWPAGLDDVCTMVVADLVGAGLRAEAHANISSVKWGKLMRNLGNAYLALCNLSVQEATRAECHRHFLADIQAEALDVLEAAGIDVEAAGRRSNRDQVARLREAGEWTHVDVPDNHDERSYPSTWQDLDSRRGRVEVEHFNGTIVKLGAEHRVATPLNEVLWKTCVAAAEAGLAPGSETCESLRAAYARNQPRHTF